jgi:hypothetical protein
MSRFYTEQSAAVEYLDYDAFAEVLEVKYRGGASPYNYRVVDYNAPFDIKQATSIGSALSSAISTGMLQPLGKPAPRQGAPVLPRV